MTAAKQFANENVTRSVRLEWNVMKFALLIMAAFLVSVPARASMTSVYVGQSAAGAGDGSSCSNQKAVSFFNTSGNWGSGAAQIGQDTTVHLCGTITSVLTAQGSGASGHPVNLQWETGASLTACDTTGSLRLTGRSYIVIDLGGNSTAITCPNNGSGLSSTVQAIGFTDGGSDWNNIEIRNGTIGPFFVNSGSDASGGFNSVCVDTANSASTHIHHVYLKGCANGIIYTLSTSMDSLNDEFDHITVDHTVGRVLNLSYSSDNSHQALNPSFHDNDVDYTSDWPKSGNGGFHYEWIHVYTHSGSGGSSEHITNLQIYNNYFHGTSPTTSASTGGVFIGTGAASLGTGFTSAKIFNNLIKDTPGGMGFSSGSGGYIYEQDDLHSIEVYNNTIDGGNNSINSCWENIVSTAMNNTFIVKNNICENAQFGPYNPSSNGPVLTFNYNDYFGLKSSGFGGYEYRNTANTSFTSWKSASSQDANSITTAPGLNSDYTITNTSSAVYQKGTNLTSLGMTPLNTGAPQTFGVTGSCGTGCVARSASAAWDIGAYAFGTVQATKPNPPTGLVVSSIQ